MYTEAEVEAIRKEEREATARATVRALRAEIIGAVKDVLSVSTKQILTTREAAHVLGCSRDRLRQHVHDGDLEPTPKSAESGKWRFLRAELDELAKRTAEKARGTG